MESLMLKDEPLGLAELESLKAQWEVKKSEAAAEVTRLQAQLGRGIILGGDNDVRPALAAAQTTVKEAELVLAEIVIWIPPAKAAQLQKQASEFRRQALEAVKQAKELESQVAALLDSIEAIEGCRYVKPAPSRFNGAGLAKSSELRRRADDLMTRAEDKEAAAAEILSKIKVNGGI